MKCSDLNCIRKPSRSRLSLTSLTNPAVEQSKIVRWSESPCNQSGMKGKGLWRKGFAEEPSLEFRMKDWAERVRKDASGDSEDDELPCVIGESAVYFVFLFYTALL